MNSTLAYTLFSTGLAVIAWVGWGFVGTGPLALLVTGIIGAVYVLGAHELRQFRSATQSLLVALDGAQQPVPVLDAWLARVHPTLQHAVRLRIEGERAPLPGPTLTPYLVGLLVMLGMLGTFLGMVMTFQGAVFALEGTADLQAMRSALSAPIKGLGLSFGTSVAGVAASAVLGLLSAMSRRERLVAGRLLDARIATGLRAYSRAFHREQSLEALQSQATALPAVLDGLKTLMDRIDTRSQQLDERLNARQAQFHSDVTAAYSDLARSVDVSLRASLKDGAEMAAKGMHPIVAAAMAEVVAESERQQSRIGGAIEAQISGVDQALAAFAHSFEQRSREMLAGAGDALRQVYRDRVGAENAEFAAWTRTLDDMAAGLAREWRNTGAAFEQRQQAICGQLEHAVQTVSLQTQAQAQHTLDRVGQLLAQSEALVRARVEAEARWTDEQAQRMDQLSEVWSRELVAMRDAEAVRGQAAIDRLGDLQAALSTQLATLGAALEEPVTRLMETAAQAPQAAAELINQMRREMVLLSEQDNRALEERGAVMERIDAIMSHAEHTAVQQRNAVESLVASATTLLGQAGAHLSQAADAQSQAACEVAAHISGSALELSALGEAFQRAVELFSESNGRLLESLQRVEAAVSQSMARSDEQLAYYVGQAREVIDLSLSAQNAVVEDLRRLQSRSAAVASEAR